MLEKQPSLKDKLSQQEQDRIAAAKKVADAKVEKKPKTKE